MTIVVFSLPPSQVLTSEFVWVMLFVVVVLDEIYMNLKHIFGTTKNPRKSVKLFSLQQIASNAYLRRVAVSLNSASLP